MVWLFVNIGFYRPDNQQFLVIFCVFVLVCHLSNMDKCITKQSCNRKRQLLLVLLVIMTKIVYNYIITQSNIVIKLQHHHFALALFFFLHLKFTPLLHLNFKIFTPFRFFSGFQRCITPLLRCKNMHCIII